MSNISNRIAEMITIKDILHKYGIAPGKHNRTQCPLHNGKDNNFCYTDQVFHCWVCGESGNAVGLVSKMFGISFQQAEIKINNDFGLNLTASKPTYRDRIKAREMQRQREAEKARALRGERIYSQLCKIRREVFAVFGEGIRESQCLDNILDTSISDPAPLAEWEDELIALKLIEGGYED